MSRRSGSLLAVLLVLAPVLLPAAGKPKKKSADLFALIAGSVFKEPGFAFPGAQVLLEPETEEANGVTLRPQKAITDARGEFAFRVPPIEAKYTLKVSAKGLKGETKKVETRGGEERVDATFMLSPASN